MIDYLKKLSDEEVELMYRAPLLVCILVAGADGNVDKKEIEQAILLAYQQTQSQSLLTDYFREISLDFEDKLKIVFQNYPYEASKRMPILMKELSGLNNLLSKLDRTFAKQFYNILMLIAEKIASSSGGILGMHTVGEEEAKIVKLPMIWDPSVQ